VHLVRAQRDDQIAHLGGHNIEAGEPRQIEHGAGARLGVGEQALLEMLRGSPEDLRSGPIERGDRSPRAFPSSGRTVAGTACAARGGRGRESAAPADRVPAQTC
jgi:hypothetical protein